MKRQLVQSQHCLGQEGRHVGVTTKLRPMNLFSLKRNNNSKTKIFADVVQSLGSSPVETGAIQSFATTLKHDRRNRAEMEAPQIMDDNARTIRHIFR